MSLITIYDTFNFLTVFMVSTRRLDVNGCQSNACMHRVPFKLYHSTGHFCSLPALTIHNYTLPQPNSTDSRHCGKHYC